jgi:hypothetical protein
VEVITYLIQAQASAVAQFHFLVFCWVGRLPVGRKPIFEQVGSLFGQVSSSLPVESAVVKADVVLEADVTTIGGIVGRVASSRIVRILGPFVAAVGCCLVIVIIALNHGWWVWVLSNGLVDSWLGKWHLALSRR